MARVSGMTFVIIVAAMLALGAGACGSAPVAESDRVGAEHSSDAKTMYQSRCGQCHVAFPPHSYSDGEWLGVMRRMAGDGGLSESEEFLLTRWLMENN